MLFIPIPNYESRYEISNNGEVRSKRRKNCILSPQKGKRGYWHLNLYKPDLKNTGRKRNLVTFLVHRLVLETFIGPCPEGMEGCHNDGNRSNNALENLRWDTRLNNATDTLKHGTRLFGENIANAKLKIEEVREIKRLLTTRTPIREVGRKFKVSKITISDIKRGKTWLQVL